MLGGGAPWWGWCCSGEGRRARAEVLGAGRGSAGSLCATGSGGAAGDGLMRLVWPLLMLLFLLCHEVIWNTSSDNLVSGEKRMCFGNAAERETVLPLTTSDS